MPIYEYKCRACGAVFEKIEVISSKSWKDEEASRCMKCKSITALRLPSKFKQGKKVLDTTGKSGYQTDELTLGKIIDEGGIPYEYKQQMKEKADMIERVRVGNKALKERAKKYGFDPSSN